MVHCCRNEVTAYVYRESARVLDDIGMHMSEMIESVGYLCRCVSMEHVTTYPEHTNQYWRDYSLYPLV